MPNEIAPEGSVFVCGACGKRSRDRYGVNPIDRGWDEACILNAFLVAENLLVMQNDRVVRVKNSAEESDLLISGKDGVA